MNTYGCLIAPAWESLALLQVCNVWKSLSRQPGHPKYLLHGLHAAWLEKSMQAPSKGRLIGNEKHVLPVTATRDILTLPQIKQAPEAS